MVKALTALIKVKTIVTLVLTGMFAYMTVTKVVTPEIFLPVFTTVIGFYFGTQAEKSK